MPRKPAKVQLMGAWEIRQRTGYSPAWVKSTVKDRTFPEPYAELRMGKVWDAADVEAWIRRYYPELVSGPKPRAHEDDEA